MTKAKPTKQLANRGLSWAFHKTFNFLASIELAVFVILAIAVFSAVGTIYEAKYDREVAFSIVYRGFWFTSILVLFMLNLLFAALSRLPWKRYHIGFLVTHLGLIILLIGSLMTALWGVDGNISMGVDETQQVVQLEEDYLHVWQAVPGKEYQRLLSKRLDYNPVSGFTGPEEWNIDLQDYDGNDANRRTKLEVLDWWPYAHRHVGVRQPPKGSNLGVPAIYFRLMGSRANIDQWLFLNGVQGSQVDLGPARIEFYQDLPQMTEGRDKRTLFIYLEKNSKGKLRPHLAQVPRKSIKIQKIGEAKPENRMLLGWMDFEFLLEEFHASAIPSTRYTKAPKGAKGAVEAIEIRLNSETRWLEMGAAAQILWDQYLFYVQYTKKQVPLGFPIRLRRFDISFYEGSTRPKSYESRVSVDNTAEQILIKMNEPLHHKNFTFYQSSYSMDQNGNPVISVLSVNRDPGRWTKYLGCLMLTLGIILMFYFRPIYSGKSKWLQKRPTEVTA